MAPLIFIIDPPNPYTYFGRSFCFSYRISLLCHLSCLVTWVKGRKGSHKPCSESQAGQEGQVVWCSLHHSLPNGCIPLTLPPQAPSTRLRKLQSLKKQSWNLELIFEVVEIYDNRTLNINVYEIQALPTVESHTIASVLYLFYTHEALLSSLLDSF